MVETVGGTQIPLDLASIMQLVAGNNLSARGQDIQMRGDDMAFWQNLIGIGEARRQTDLAYGADAARFGLDVANFNYNQRMGKIQADLANNDQLLSQENFNFLQRSGLVDRKLGIVDRLTARQGPQDYVAYDALINQLSPRTPERSATIDPFEMLQGLVKELTLTPADTSKLDQPYAGAFPSLDAAGAQSDANNPYQSLAGQMSLSPVREFATPKPTTTAGQTFTGGPSFASDPYGNPLKPGNAADLGGQIKTYTSGPASSTPKTWQDLQTEYNSGTGGGIDPVTGKYIPPKYERGGMAGPGPIVTGDSKSGRENQEIVMALTSDPNTKLMVMPVDKMKGKKGMGGMKKAMKKMPKAESGGTYGTATTDPVFQFNQYTPEQLGGAGFLQAALGKRTQAPFQGFGSPVSNPSIGVNNFPSTINLQAFRDLGTTGRDALGSVVEQGLGLSYADLLERSRRAAPFGREFGVSAFKG